MITDVEKINYLMCAITFFSPEGHVYAIEKVEGLNYHIQYIKFMLKSFKELKQVLKDVDLNYYLENPNLVYSDLLPIFVRKGYAIYFNLAPNTYRPTNCAMMLLPEKRGKLLLSKLVQSEKKLSSICFYDIGVYNSKNEEFDSFIPDDFDFEKPNSYMLYNIITPVKEKQKNLKYASK